MSNISSINNTIQGLTEKIKEIADGLDGDRQSLESDLDKTRNQEIRNLYYHQMFQNTRLRQIMILLEISGIVNRYLGELVEKKVSKEELDIVQKNLGQVFEDQSKKFEETLKPLSEEINKTLERQERNKGVYS